MRPFIGLCQLGALCCSRSAPRHNRRMGVMSKLRVAFVNTHLIRVFCSTICWSKAESHVCGHSAELVQVLGPPSLLLLVGDCGGGARRTTYQSAGTPMHYIDILAVGHAPVLQINRRIYRALARLGWQVEIAIPRRLPWSSDLNFVQPDHPEDPPIHRLEPRGHHIRFWSFEGLTDLLNRKRPRIVYLENGPDSLMAWVIGGWCRRNDAFLIANTNENDILPIREILRGWRPKASLRSLRSHIWGRLARGRVSHVVAICEDGRNSMRSIGFGDAVTVTPLGFDPALFYPDASRRAAIRRALGLTEPSRRLLWSRNSIKRRAHTHCSARSSEGSTVAVPHGRFRTWFNYGRGLA